MLNCAVLFGIGYLGVGSHDFDIQMYQDFILIFIQYGLKQVYYCTSELWNFCLVPSLLPDDFKLHSCPYMHICVCLCLCVCACADYGEWIFPKLFGVILGWIGLGFSVWVSITFAEAALSWLTY